MISFKQFEEFRQTFPQILKEDRDFHHDQKKSAHERIFKVTMAISTLTLTGWVVIIAQLPEAFLNHHTTILVSCALFIASVILISLGDLCILQLTRFSYKLNSIHHVEWSAAAVAASTLSTHSSFKTYSEEQITGKLIEILQGIHQPTEEKTRYEKSQTLYMRLSWIFGVAGYFVFIIASLFAIKTIPEYVSTARKLQIAQALLDKKPVSDKISSPNKGK